MKVFFYALIITLSAICSVIYAVLIRSSRLEDYEENRFTLLRTYRAYNIISDIILLTGITGFAELIFFEGGNTRSSVLHSALLLALTGIGLVIIFKLVGIYPRIVISEKEKEHRQKEHSEKS